jgi:hypothetical protein
MAGDILCFSRAEISSPEAPPSLPPYGETPVSVPEVILSPSLEPTATPLYSIVYICPYFSIMCK